MDTIHALVREKSGKEMERQKRLYDKGKVEDQFKIGDKVWQRTSQRTKGKTPKLQKKWLGPRLIVQQFTRVTYMIADGVRKHPQVVHFDRLKLYKGDKNPAWMKNYVQPTEEDDDAVDAEFEDTSDGAESD